MTGNKSFLTDYQEIDGGFVTFGGSPKEVTAGNQTNRNAVHRAQRIAELDNLLIQQKEGYANSTNIVSTVSPSVSTVGQSFDTLPSYSFTSTTSLPFR
ncbi:hypothetical protein Tco_0176649, partial [Tanacetum coccineum]